MTLEIHRIDPARDYELFEKCYRWLQRSPRWRRDTEAVFGTMDQEEYLAAAHRPGRVDIGVFDGNLIAKVALHLVARNTYEVSLEASRNVNLEAIIIAGCLIRDQLFGWYGAELAVMWVLTRHTGMHRIVHAIGFKPTGVTMLRRTPAGRVMEWQLFTLRSDYEQQKQTADPADTESGVHRY
jgi:hypothetical protein